MQPSVWQPHQTDLAWQPSFVAQSLRELNEMNARWSGEVTKCELLLGSLRLDGNLMSAVAMAEFDPGAEPPES